MYIRAPTEDCVDARGKHKNGDALLLPERGPATRALASGRACPQPLVWVYGVCSPDAELAFRATLARLLVLRRWASRAPTLQQRPLG